MGRDADGAARARADIAESPPGDQWRLKYLQIGLAVEVIAITSVAANLAAILGGILVFGSRSAPARQRSSPACLRSAS